VAMAILDLLFNVGLCLALLHPIVRARRWGQIIVCLKVFALLLANLLFYLGLFGIVSDGQRLGFYSGLYLIIALILLIGRRVIPFFIEKGVDESVRLRNYKWLDIAPPILLLVFILLEVFARQHLGAAVVAALLFAMHLLRMVLWHTRGIWKKPLLWVLYCAYGWITLGFAMQAMSFFVGLDPSLATHAFAYGGIGMMALGMMARVSLGHTGRDVFNPPVVLKWIFLCLLVGGIARVLMPLLAPAAYSLWIASAQILWVVAFAVFTWLYTPMLIQPRVDGRYG